MIVVPENRIMHHQGFSEQYMQEVGLLRTDLKKLERKGLAFRAYMPRPPRPNQLKKMHSGYETRWMLVKDAEIPNNDNVDTDSHRG